MRCGTFRALALLLSLTLGCAHTQTAPKTAPSNRPKAIILMIGDGFGISQLTFSRNLLVGATNRLTLESLPITALVSTHSTDPVTDSGAAATAISSGVKIDNKYVGCTVDLKALRSIADLAQSQGWKIGYVTTTRVTHATPASFYGHAHRDNEKLIAAQLVDQKPDIAMGGGLGQFSADLQARAGADYTILKTRAELLNAPPGKRLLGLFANGHLKYGLDNRREPEDRRDPSLSEMTRVALDRLGSGNGSFFLMIEGGRIDQAAHSFDAAGIATETRSFDDAVKAVLEYQKEHPDTLIVLTADHATGGLDVNDYVDWEGIKRQTASVNWMISQIRGGKGSELIEEHTGYGDFTGEEIQRIRQAPEAFDAERVLGTMLAIRNGATWMPRITEKTYGHTGEDVHLYSGGPGAQSFQGVLDNTDISRILAGLVGWSWPPDPVEETASTPTCAIPKQQ
jgi:alkaline phosphatase